MIKEILYAEALKFGADWPVGILHQYAKLYAERCANFTSVHGSPLTTAEETLYQELQSWLSTMIKTGVCHKQGDWTDGRI